MTALSRVDGLGPLVGGCPTSRQLGPTMSRTRPGSSIATPGSRDPRVIRWRTECGAWYSVADLHAEGLLSKDAAAHTRNQDLRVHFGHAGPAFRFPLRSLWQVATTSICITIFVMQVRQLTTSMQVSQMGHLSSAWPQRDSTICGKFCSSSPGPKDRKRAILNEPPVPRTTFPPDVCRTGGPSRSTRNQARCIPPLSALTVELPGWLPQPGLLEMAGR